MNAMNNFMARMKEQAELKAKVYARIGLDCLDDNVRKDIVAGGYTEEELLEYEASLKAQVNGK